MEAICAGTAPYTPLSGFKANTFHVSYTVSVILRDGYMIQSSCDAHPASIQFITQQFHLTLYSTKRGVFKPLGNLRKTGVGSDERAEEGCCRSSSAGVM